MAVGEEGATVADPRFSLAGCAAADRDKFAERILIADFQISRFALVFQVLGLLADGAVSVEFVFSAGLHRPAECNVMLEPAVWAEHHIGAYHAIGPDDCPCPDLCAGINNRGRVNLHVAHLSRNVNISSPSETTASFTTQWHFAFARRSPRDLVSSAWIKMVSPGKTGLRNFTSSALMK